MHRLGDDLESGSGPLRTRPSSARVIPCGLPAGGVSPLIPRSGDGLTLIHVAGLAWSPPAGREPAWSQPLVAAGFVAAGLWQSAVFHRARCRSPFDRLGSLADTARYMTQKKATISPGDPGNQRPPRRENVFQNALQGNETSTRILPFFGEFDWQRRAGRPVRSGLTGTARSHSCVSSHRRRRRATTTPSRSTLILRTAPAVSLPRCNSCATAFPSFTWSPSATVSRNIS